MNVACAVHHDFESECSWHFETSHTANSGQVVFTIGAKPACPIRLTKYMVYHTSKTATPDDISGCAEWTLDRVIGQGFGRLLADQEEYLRQFWHRSDVQVSDIKPERARLAR